QDGSSKIQSQAPRRDFVVRAMSQPELFPPEFISPEFIPPKLIAQATAPSSTPPSGATEGSGASPAPAFTPVPPPSQTPDQVPPPTLSPFRETPNQLQFDLTPGVSPPNLNLPPVQPPPTPPTPSVPGEGPQTPPPVVSPEAEPRVLVSEVVVSGVEGDLQNTVYQVLRTRPGRTVTRSELNEDINAIFATGFFSTVRAVPEDTPLGVRVTFEVQPNPVLTGVKVQGNQVLPQTVVDDIFKDQYGSILNLRRFQEGITALNKWYQDQGYVLAQVIGAPQVSESGAVTLEVAEGVVEDVKVNFLNKEGEATDAQGQPIKGRTREFIITREFNLKPGQVFNRSQAERDLQRVFGLGIFEDVRLSLNPGTDPRKVIVVANVIEKNTGSIAAGLGISSASGLFGTISYQEQNLGGNNQKIGGEIQLGERELLFNISFTDPWIAGDPFRTAYSVNLFNQRSISLVFDNGPVDVNLPNGDTPRVDRLGGGLTFTRPLDGGISASLGLQYQQVSIRDADRNITPFDALGNPLSISSSGVDDLLTVQFGVVQDRRNNPLQPTSGSLFRFGTEQSIPVGSGSILMNRLRASYSYYMPVKFINFSEGAQALAFNIQTGTVLGTLPPYEAFVLGGSSSVRGYEEGAVGTGRSFVQATAEYRFPLFPVIGGALFVDAATDLGSGSSVIGNPAQVRGKPGGGIGYGIGVRIQSPLGPIRIDYGINDQGNNRIHFGIGERF
ncbi:MAG: BamA/TamA family outer membrane protein, partial [Leptolyngbyaceae bacterium]|nr:BamA/TamA family outer membrane protein [Leptolyngbyaceae bacterium]